MRPAVIAHRGASGYLPEHTLPAKALAYAMGADFLEQDLVASRDDHLLVLHDIYLDRISNVAQMFPQRRRDDGRYYARDFELAELRTLTAWERMNADGSAVYAGRYPAQSGNFRLHTLAEELDMIAALNASTGRSVGIYPEIKRPAWHRQQGIDIAPRLLDELAAHGYVGRHANAFVQCFDAQEIIRLRRELATELPLIQLIGENSWGEAPTDFDTLLTGEGLADVSEVADGIGPFIKQLYRVDGVTPVSRGVVEVAHSHGLLVHPYTFRSDSLPAGFATFDRLLEFALITLDVDGVFTDFPDKVRQFIDRRPRRETAANVV